MENKDIIVICSGGFDPIHKGHIEYFKSAKKLGTKLIVALNSDNWLIRKKGKYFMDWVNREAILNEFKCVYDVISFDDDDDSAIDAINKVKSQYPNNKIIFANGGDRIAENIPEFSVDDVEFSFGIGGDTKLNSSSWILNSWESWILSKQIVRTDRIWGYYEVINEISPHIKVKRLVVYPGKSLSYQKHNHRNEFWIVESGEAYVLLKGESSILVKNDYINIPRKSYHTIKNNTLDTLVIFEIQHGDLCVEDDIIRV